MRPQVPVVPAFFAQTHAELSNAAVAVRQKRPDDALDILTSEIKFLSLKRTGAAREISRSMFQSFGPNPPTFAATLRPHGRMLLSLTQAEGRSPCASPCSIEGCGLPTHIGTLK